MKSMPTFWNDMRLFSRQSEAETEWFKADWAVFFIVETVCVGNYRHGSYVHGSVGMGSNRVGSRKRGIHRKDRRWLLCLWLAKD